MNNITVESLNPSEMNYNDCQMTLMWICYEIIPRDFALFFFFSFFLSLCVLLGISAKEISGWESVRVNYDKRMTVHLDGENCWWDFHRSATKLG